MNTTTQPIYVGVRHDHLNITYLAITPLEGGMEQVDLLAPNTPEWEKAQELVAQARAYGSSLGSVQSTYSVEGPGGSNHQTLAIHYTNKWAAPRFQQGTHKALLGQHQTPSQRALAEEASAQKLTSIPKPGDRWIVSHSEGHLLIQDRPLAHRECGCHTGTTTYLVGEVQRVIWWMDNSIEVQVLGEDGQTYLDQLKAPSGDAC